MELEKLQIALSDGRTVEMREPLLRDVRMSGNIKNLEERTVRIASNLTGLTEEELLSLRMRDWRKIQDALNGFLGSSGETALTE
jgi:hypothetical protein